MERGTGREREQAAASSEATALVSLGPRERILAAAADLFYRKGVHAVGVDAIIASARVAKASFYHHFRSKDDLVVAWLMSQDARWLDRVVVETERRADDAKGRLLAFFEVVAELIAEPGFRGCPYLNTAAELRNERGPASEVIAEFYGETRAYLAGLAAKAGSRSPDEVGAALHVLVAGVFAATLALGDDSPAVAARGVAQTLVAAST